MERKLTNIVRWMADNDFLLCKENAVLYTDKVYSIDVRSVSSCVNCNYELLNTFYCLCDELKLPVHNAVAFFQKVLENERDLCKNLETREQLQAVLAYAVVAHGFVFSTTFAREGSQSLRFCDLYFLNKDKNSEERLISTIIAHAKLKTAGYFFDDFEWFKSKTLKELQEGKKRFQLWQAKEMEESSATGVIKLHPKQLDSFFCKFKDYSLMQVKDDVIGLEKIKSELKKIENAGRVVITIDRFWNCLNRIATCHNTKSKKQRWLHLFKQYLTANKGAIKRAEEFLHNNGDILNLSTIIDGLTKTSISKSFIKEYPVFDENKELKPKFKGKKMLSAYQKSGLFTCISMVTKVLSNPTIQLIAPYYLTHVFIHKLNPIGPFTKKNYQFEAIHKKLNDKVTITHDKRAIQYQHTHRFLYDFMCRWWTDVYESGTKITLHDSELCDFLYMRCRRYLLKSDYFFDRDDKHRDFQALGDHLQQIQTSLKYVFEPNIAFMYQYNKQMIDKADFYSFLDNKNNKRDRKILKRLSEIVTDKIAEEFKSLALTDHVGIGMSAPPLSWHFCLARWMNELINNDTEILKYVMGEPDPDYPGSNIKLSQLIRGITFCPGNEIYPEHHQPYLARVQLAIQQLCFERIQKTMTVEVTRLYKRVFMGDYE